MALTTKEEVLQRKNGMRCEEYEERQKEIKDKQCGQEKIDYIIL